MCKSKRRLEGKTVLVTGGNIGIGLETARDMAKRGEFILLLLLYQMCIECMCYSMPSKL